MMAQGQYSSAMEETKAGRKPQDADKYMVRMPDGMRDRIAEVSKKSGRSMNQEIVHRLSLTFAWEEAEHPEMPTLLDEIASTADRLQDLLRELRMQQVVLSQYEKPTGEK